MSHSIHPAVHALNIAALLALGAGTNAAAAVPGASAPFREAMDRGREILHPRANSGVQQPLLRFPEARDAYRRALALAQTDPERAAAYLAIAECQLYDWDERDFAAVRRECAGVLDLPGASPEQRARATLGIGETYLREKEYRRARSEFARAKETCPEPDLMVKVQFAVARSYLQERNYTAARQEFSRLRDAKGMDPRRKLEAEAYLNAIVFQPRVRQDHPRLFFNRETWPAVKARALGVEREYFARMQAEVAAIRPGSPGLPEPEMALMKAAFVYRVTGDEAVLVKVRAMLAASVERFLQRATLDNGGHPRVACLAALDWVWDDLPPAEREGLADGMLRYASRFYTEWELRGMLHRQNWYYEKNMLWYAGLALLDDRLDDVDYAQVLAILGQGYSDNMDDLGTHVRRAGDDGGWHVNLEYCFRAMPTIIWSFMYTLQSATGAAIPEEWLSAGVSPDYTIRNILGYGRERWGLRHFNYSRSWGGGHLPSDVLHDHLGHFIHFFGERHPDLAAIAHHVRARIQDAGQPTAGKYPVYPFLMTNLEKVPARPLPASLPLARHFENVGLVLMSSGFGPADTYALFAAGGAPDYDSEHLDATHFTIYKRGLLALDTGFRNEPYGADTYNYWEQTVAHNAVLIRMPGEVSLSWKGQPIAANAAGQNKTTRYARVVAFESRPHFAYVATDATATYAPEKCAQMVRQFLFLTPDWFIVFDRVVATRAEFPKTWLLHTADEPVVAGREFRADREGGRLFCRTLYPLDAILKKVGGPGREFWVDGRNYTIPEDFRYWRYFANFGARKEDGVPPDMGRWRVEVKPGAAREEDCFLHLIQVSGRGLEKMVESQVSEKDNRIELVFAANGRGYTIGLNKTGEVGGHVRIVEAGKVVVDRALTQAIMPQSGLALDR
ncbi:MAG: heparinase II/III family protein [Armatimonadetes bacterium]|nr:heparinase II/III family protein [Armatimonadota bacterium]